MKIKEIKFGSSDGYTESQEPNFSELYYDNEGYFDNLLNSRKYIIYGRKGTGKTTLASYYCHKTKNDSRRKTKQLFSNDFFQKKLLNFAENDINKEENSLFWEYTFLLDLGHLILDYYNSLPFYYVKKFFSKKSIINLKNIIKEETYKINQITSDSFVQSNGSGSFELSKSPKISSESGVIFSENESVQKRRAKYYEVLPSLKELVFDLVKVFKVDLTLFYDDMDQFEETMILNDFKRLMKSMIYTSDRLNKELNSISKSKVCLVMREDIIDMLQYEANNLNKQITDCGIRIDWFSSAYREPFDHPLMQMLLHKIKKSGEDFSKLSLKDIHDKIFENGVFEYMMVRSFGRPRDLIQFLNLYQKSFPNDETVSIVNLNKVEQEYSKWFHDELLNEIAISSDKEGINEILEYISKRGYRRFTYQKLSNYIAEHDQKTIINLLELLSVMRKYSILGVENKGKIAFPYRLGYSVNVDKTTKFILHQGLHKFFNIN